MKRAMCCPVACSHHRSVPEAGARSAARKPANRSLIRRAITNWTTKTELFAEYPPLIAGQTSRFAIHLTRLDTFKPIEGQSRIRSRRRPAAGRVFTADGPSRPGIFGVDVKPSASGRVHAVHSSERRNQRCP